MHALQRDFQYALHALRKRPGFVAVTVLTLGLGICANTAVFSFFNGMVLHRFPYPEGDRLVRLWGSNPEIGAVQTNVSLQDVLLLREQSKHFSDITAFATSRLAVSGQAEPVRLPTGVVLVNFFSVLGVEPALGRNFRSEESRSGQHQVVILSHGFWHRYFGGDRDVIGKTIVLEGDPYSIIGVAPADFEHPTLSSAGPPDLWKPIAVAPPPSYFTSHALQAVGRLRPGAGLAAAQREMDALAQRLEEMYPETNAGWGIALEPQQQSETRQARPAILIMLSVVATVLLIACVNVANLFLARGVVRRQEFALRMALGAGRRALFRQLLLESLILALLGGALALLLTPGAIRLLASLSPVEMPRMDAVRIDGKVLAFSFGLSIVTGLLFGLVPALRVSRVDLQGSLKEAPGRGTGGGSRRAWTRSALTAGQLALSVILLVMGGLLAKSFLRILSVDPGMEVENLLTMEIMLPDAGYEEDHQIQAFYEQTLERLTALPAVESAGAVNMLPLTERYSCNGFSLGDRPAPEEGQMPCADYRSVAGSYLEATGIALRQGRLFDRRDRDGALPVAIVNEAMAKSFWPDASPLGKQVRWGGIDSEAPWRTIVGVIADVKHRGLTSEGFPEMYIPHLQDLPNPPSRMVLALRTASDPLAAVAQVRDVIWSIDRSIPIDDIETMESKVAKSLWLERLGTVSIAIVSAIALLLALLGLYGLIAYLVNQRGHEFGVRMALGARRRDILGLVLGQGVKLALVGLGIGLLGAYWSGRLAARILFGVSSHDPVVFAGVSLVLVTVALLACLLPALRASRVDPAVGLRYE